LRVHAKIDRLNRELKSSIAENKEKTAADIAEQQKELQMGCFGSLQLSRGAPSSSSEISKRQDELMAANQAKKNAEHAAVTKILGSIW
jgi:hypothetical protein